MSERLAGKVCLVTGSAQGQGEAEARLFVEEGARVVVTDVLDAAGAAVAADLGEAATYLHLDVARPDGWDAARAAVLDRYGRLDVLVNNAGIGLPPVAIDESPLEDHHRIIDVNLHGVYLGMRALAPVIAAGGGGSIVNISSIDGLVGIAGLTSYVASKFAVSGMTRSAALEWGRRGVRVNSIHPGVIETPLVRNAPAAVHERLRAVLDRQPIPRMGTAREVAYLALFLASDESSYCTGGEFVIDGGHIAGPWRPGPWNDA
jgi:3alpha(or 20beta)-hydroxysteroid dehydrogenase